MLLTSWKTNPEMITDELLAGAVVVEEIEVEGIGEGVRSFTASSTTPLDLDDGFAVGRRVGRRDGFTVVVDIIATAFVIPAFHTK